MLNVRINWYFVTNSLGFWFLLEEFDDSKSSPDVNLVGDFKSDELVDIESSFVLSDCRLRFSYRLTASPEGFTTSKMLIRFVSHSTVTLICTSASSPAAKHCSFKLLLISSWKLTVIIESQCFRMKLNYNYLFWVLQPKIEVPQFITDMSFN